MKTDDGGPAFPVHPESHNRSDAEYNVLSGMTLRDWFAGQALAGLLADTEVNSTFLNVAARCYTMADAMIESRSAHGRHTGEA